mmetsp:Transcript_2348/g.3533  ORF Transcript_2348/g.3533 Transcript_2348/m.3533 type:complete len:149 (+) Transcript_2348:972-1418(+)
MILLKLRAWPIHAFVKWLISLHSCGVMSTLVQLLVVVQELLLLLVILGIATHDDDLMDIVIPDVALLAEARPDIREVHHVCGFAAGALPFVTSLSFRFWLVGASEELSFFSFCPLLLEVGRGQLWLDTRDLALSTVKILLHDLPSSST